MPGLIWLLIFSLISRSLTQMPDFDETKLNANHPMIDLRRLRDKYYLRTDLPPEYKDDIDETFLNVPNEILKCHYKELGSYEDCIYIACDMARKIFEEIEDVAKERAAANWKPK